MISCYMQKIVMKIAVIAIVTVFLDLFIYSIALAGECGGIPERGNNPYNCCSCSNNAYPCDTWGPNCSTPSTGGGNCVWYAWQRRYNEGDPLPDVSWGDAGDWAVEAAADNFDVANDPQVGAIAVSETIGHVAYVVSFTSTTVTVDEQNCCMEYNTRFGHVWNRSNFQKYILPKTNTVCGCPCVP